MLDNLESLTIIICTILGTAIATVTTIFSLQKSFREHINNLLLEHDRNLKNWISKALEEYYNPIDDRLKNLNYRLKNIEKKE